MESIIGETGTGKELVARDIHFNGILSKSQGRLKYVPPKTLDLLMRYSWRGNVRELENVIERAVVMGKGDAILAQDLSLEIQKISCLSRLIIPSGRLSLKERVGELEKELILNALEETGWVQTKAAKLLGISRRIIRWKSMGYKEDEKRKFLVLRRIFLVYKNVHSRYSSSARN